MTVKGREGKEEIGGGVNSSVSKKQSREEGQGTRPWNREKEKFGLVSHLFGSV